MATPKLQLAKDIWEHVAVAVATEQTAQFKGSGLDDLTAGGTTTGINQVFEVEIDGVNTPDTFRWRVNRGTWTSAVDITGAAQTLSDGLTVTFTATTGHTLGDSWIVYVSGNRVGNFERDVVAERIVVTNVDGTNAAEITISQAYDGAPLVAHRLDVAATTIQNIDLAPGMLFKHGILLSAEAASDLTATVVGSQALPSA